MNGPSMPASMALSDETKGWLRHIAWSCTSAILVAVAQKAVDIAAEKLRARRKEPTS